jgi:hypothetical protein
MTSWNDEIAAELLHAQWAAKEQNDGRLRTCARRMAGIALMQYYRNTKDFVALLRLAMHDAGVPEEVKLAAERLQSRMRPDFSSALTDPLGDALTVVEFVDE